MSNPPDPATIELFWKLHEGLPMQGPGSDASTRRALSLVPGLRDEPDILDLGCGPGRQSIVLAAETGGRVTAIDALPPFLKQLDQRAQDAGLGDRITTRTASMGELSDYPDESFDLLWSEGAIYNIGFESGLRSWHRLLRPGCAVAVTEATWLTEAAPQKVREFWQTEYPEMQNLEDNERAIERAGYRPLGSFVLPENEWWEGYYTPIEERLAVLREERSDPEWQAAVAENDREIAVVREGLKHFGYVFYVMQKEAAKG